MKGSAKVELGATVFGRQLGPVKLYEGAFDWTFQYKANLNGLARLVMPQGGQAISLGKLGGLPGLGGVGSLPKLPDLGFPDFSKVSTPNVAKLAGQIPSLRTPNITIPLSSLGIGSLPPLRFQVPSGAGAIFGFPVKGDVSIAASERSGVKGVDVAMNLALPSYFGGITGSGRLWVGINGRVDIDALGVNATEVTLPGLIRVAPVKLAYDGPKNTWEGDASVFLGFQSKDTGLGGRWLIVDGQLRRIGVTATGVPLGSVATLDSLNANLTLDGSKSRVFGSVGVGAGPRIPVLNTRAIGINGTFDFNGNFAKLTGDLRVANVPLANAAAEYWWNGYFKASGQVKYFLDGKKEYGFEGNIGGRSLRKGLQRRGVRPVPRREALRDGQGPGLHQGRSPDARRSRASCGPTSSSVPGTCGARSTSTGWAARATSPPTAPRSVPARHRPADR